MIWQMSAQKGGRLKIHIFYTKPSRGIRRYLVFSYVNSSKVIYDNKTISEKKSKEEPHLYANANLLYCR